MKREGHQGRREAARVVSRRPSEERSREAASTARGLRVSMKKGTPMRLLMLFCLLATLVVLPFGCGGDDINFPGSERTETPTPTETAATQTPTTTPTTTPTP